MSKKRVTQVNKQRSGSWNEALQEFIFWKQAQGLSKTTLNDYKDYAQRFFKRFPDCWQTPELKNSIIQFMADDVKPATFNLRLTYLRGFFQWSVDEGYLSENPLEGFK